MKDNICELKDKYKGQRAWIIGNGPSLLSTNLSLIKEKTFACNAISLLFPKTEWRPDFYTCFQLTTPALAVIRSMEPVRKAGVTCIVSSRFVPMNLLENFPETHFESFYALSSANIVWRELQPCDWMTNGWWVYGFGTAVYASAQIITYLGFEEIVFVGCDMNWQGFEDGNDINHFHPNYNNGLSLPLNDVQTYNIEQRILVAHRAIKARCEERNVKVLNATIGGCLEIYPRVNFSEIV